MADVTGPISTLPGSWHSTPDGMMCDDHPERPAYRRVQGETDSFGSEMHDMCKECFQEYNSLPKTHCGTCDWCKSKSEDLRPRRDYDEGLAGPVYSVCGDCVKRENERLEEELYGDSYYPDPYDYNDDDCY